MKSKRIILYVCVFLCLTGCRQEQSSDSNQVIDVERFIQSERDAKLSDISDSIACIALETTEESLLGNRAHVLYADRENLFVRSDLYLYRFDAKGRFLNRIGRVGSGPEEYAMLSTAVPDVQSGRWLFLTGPNQIQIWDDAGNFQGRISLQTEKQVTTIALLPDRRISAECRQYTDTGLETSIELFDSAGNRQSEVWHSSYEGSNKVGMSVWSFLYLSGDTLRYKNPYDNRLYSLSADTMSVFCDFHLGKYTPTKELLEDMDQRKTLEKEKIQVVDLRESASDFYLLLLQNRQLYGMIVDKARGHAKFSRVISMPQRGGGIENDYIPGTSFWPMFADAQGVAYGLLPMAYLPEESQADVNKYTPTTFRWSDDANPIVLKVY